MEKVQKFLKRRKDEGMLVDVFIHDTRWNIIIIYLYNIDVEVNKSREGFVATVDFSVNT